uniref:FMRFamide receptor n=1 Tax=Ascaris suum TaxID=6253 RepID=F1L6M3_ASCSU
MNEILRYECITDNIDWTTWTITGPVTTTIAVLGVWGNLVSLKIFRSLSIRPSVRLYLSVLAIANSFVSFCSIWYYSLAEMLKPLLGTIRFFQYVTVIMHPVSFLSITAAVWMLLTVTADRYFALARPLRHRAHDSLTRARCVYVSILFAAVLYSLPTLFEMRVSDECARYTNDTRLIVVPTDLRLDPDYISIYSVTLNMIFITVGPFCLITILSIRMIFIVAKARSLRIGMDARATLSGRSTSQENTTVMLLAVAVKFLLCNYLMIAVNIWEHLAGSQIAVGTLYKLCVELSNLLVVVNSASDSIVYFRWRQKRPPAVSCSNALKTLFTPDEANLLKNEFMCHQSSKMIGSQLTDLMVLDNEELARDERICIQTLLEEMLSSIGDPIAEQNIANKLNFVGSQHAQISIPASTWNKFKTTLIEEMSTNDSRHLWSRLACMFIKEFRCGQSFLKKP